MKISLRHFRIQISTLVGTFGIDIPFERGLVVVRAENTSGKSTCVQGIIYALGLEAMLTAQTQTPPLQYAVLDFLFLEKLRRSSPGVDKTARNRFWLVEMIGSIKNYFTFSANSRADELNIVADIPEINLHS